MNIHIMLDAIFTRDYANFLNRNYNNNIIYVRRTSNMKYVDESINNLYVVDKFPSNLFKKIGDDKLFIHGIYDLDIIKFLFKNLKKIDSQKIVIAIWGRDLYNNYFTLMDNKLHIKVRALEYMKKKILKKCSMYMTFASPDFDLLCDIYGVDGKQFDCLYPASIDEQFLTKILNNTKVDKNDCINILVGNSATRTNQHREVLEVLRKFKDEKIKIFCPLSYGDGEEYKNSIINMGKNVFGDKFIPITEFMEQKEYVNFLNKMDIAIFNNNRQQATANIDMLGFLKKKIFIRSDVAMWGHYVVRDKCNFFDTKTIGDLSFAEFCDFDYHLAEKNNQYFSKIWSEEYIKKIWNIIFDYKL